MAVAVVLLLGAHAGTDAMAPLYDPVTLNIGINCEWQRSCQKRQLKAMKSARDYIARSHPPLWRIHLCNRNAARTASRIDWVGFNSCIRNLQLRPPGRRR